MARKTKATMTQELRRVGELISSISDDLAAYSRRIESTGTKIVDVTNDTCNLAGEIVDIVCNYAVTRTNEYFTGSVNAFNIRQVTILLNDMKVNINKLVKEQTKNDEYLGFDADITTTARMILRLFQSETVISR